MLGKGIMTLFEKLADREDGRLMSQHNDLIGVWMSGSFIESERGRGEEIQYKGHKSWKYLLEWPDSEREWMCS